MYKLNYLELGNLLIDFKNGNSSAFDQIYEATYPHQLGLAYQLLKNDAQAEDIVQDSYLTLFHSIHRIKDPRALIAYLNTITRNKCVDKIRYDSKITYLSNDISDYSEFLSDSLIINKLSEDVEIIDSALSKLSTRDRKIIEMKYYENMKIKEISDILNISPRTVNRYLASSLSKLKMHATKYKNSSFVFFPVFLILPIKNCFNIIHAKLTKLGISFKETFFYKLDSILSLNSVVAISSLSLLITLAPNDIFFTPVVADSYVAGAKVFYVENLNIEDVKDIKLLNATGQYIEDFIYNHPYILIQENGDYIVKIINATNQVIYKNLEINNIDNIAPKIEILDYNSISARIKITDNLAGINPSSLYISSGYNSDFNYTILVHNNFELDIYVEHLALPFHIDIKDNVNNKNSSKISWNY